MRNLFQNTLKSIQKVFRTHIIQKLRNLDEIQDVVTETERSDHFSPFFLQNGELIKYTFMNKIFQRS